MSRNAVLEDLRSERDRSRDAALELVSSADYEPGSEALKGLEERTASLDNQIERMVRLMESQDAADALDGRLAKGARQQERAGREPETRELSWGEQWARSSIAAEYPGRGTSAKLDIQIQERALPHSLAALGAALPSSPIYDLTPPVAPDVLIPLTNVITVSTNSVDYIVWELADPAMEAKVVAPGATKPELEWVPNVTSSSLDTIAGRTSFHRSMAEDMSAVQSFINGELQREVSRKVEKEARAAVAAATLPTATGPADSGISGAIRAGMAVVEAAGYTSNAAIVHPNDAVAIDIASMGQFRGDPYWGLRIVHDPEATEGVVTLGDFASAVQHYRRNAVQLYVTDSHSTHFAENILDALAEQRAKTVVTRPAALVEVTATTGP